jgi:hypothetical protein
MVPQASNLNGLLQSSNLQKELPSSSLENDRHMRCLIDVEVFKRFSLKTMYFSSKNALRFSGYSEPLDGDRVEHRMFLQRNPMGTDSYCFWSLVVKR